MSEVTEENVEQGEPEVKEPAADVKADQEAYVAYHEAGSSDPNSHRDRRRE
jgi:hypothetical protein